MTRVYAVVEGQSEERFFTDIVAPALWARRIAIVPILLKKTGGDPRWARVKSDVVKFLKQDHGAFVTTMFDLYGLGQDWPGRQAPFRDGIAAADCIETCCKLELAAELPDELRIQQRFLPHIQPYEIEGLLFSDTAALAGSIPGCTAAAELAAIRQSVATPEHINDGSDTAPSKRIRNLIPRYNKVLYASVAAQAVSMATMRAECRHFAEWIAKLESLANS